MMNVPFSTDASKYRIVVAEDHRLLLDSLTFYLRLKGYEVYPFVSGSQAYEFFQQCKRDDHPVNLLITDLEMPIMTGKELIAAIRRTDQLFPILVMTNMVMPEEIERLMRFGSIDCIEKPFRLPALNDRVESLLAERMAAGVAALASLKVAASRWMGCFTSGERVETVIESNTKRPEYEWRNAIATVRTMGPGTLHHA